MKLPHPGNLSDLGPPHIEIREKKMETSKTSIRNGVIYGLIGAI